MLLLSDFGVSVITCTINSMQWALSKNNQKSAGFTIVELLIVVVVIGILAAIVTVAYTGVQAQARTSAGQSLASNIAKKAEAFKVFYDRYPRTCELQTDRYGSSGSPCSAGTSDVPNEVKLNNANLVVFSASATGADYTTGISNNNAAIGYYYCNAGITAVNVYYMDFSNSNAVVKVRLNGGC